VGSFQNNATNTVKGAAKKIENKAGIDVDPNAYTGTPTADGTGVVLNDAAATPNDVTSGKDLYLYSQTASQRVYVDGNGLLYVQSDPKQKVYTYTGLNAADITNPTGVLPNNQTSSQLMIGPGGAELTAVGAATYKDSSGNIYAFDQTGSIMSTGLKMDQNGNLQATTLTETDDVTYSKGKIIANDALSGAAGSAVTLNPFGIGAGALLGAAKGAFQSTAASIYSWATNPAEYNVPGEITFTDNSGNSLTMDKFVVQGIINNAGSNKKAGVAAINSIVTGKH
jgi:hypothetical protein